MKLDISQIMLEKLTQMEENGVLQKKIEETIEKCLVDSVSNAFSSLDFRKSIEEQLKGCVSTLAQDCSLSAYNTFISNHVQALVSELLEDDLKKKLQAAVDDILIQKHENVKLSDIFRKYREYVMDAVDAEDKYDRGNFVSQLDTREDGPSFTFYTCRFSPFSEWEAGEGETVELKFCQYKDRPSDIMHLIIGGTDMKNALRMGHFDDFERYVLNLFFNKTEIILDAEEVEKRNDNSYYED